VSYIDLVFYNFKLKCFLLVDLKLGKLKHQDVGQMDTYVRLYDEQHKGADDNPTIGLVLCSEKSEAVVKYSVLSEQKQLFSAKYLPYLPTEEQLKHEPENTQCRAAAASSNVSVKASVKSWITYLASSRWNATSGANGPANNAKP